jgi:hypothetical protein
MIDLASVNTNSYYFYYCSPQYAKTKKPATADSKLNKNTQTGEQTLTQPAALPT